MADSGPVAAKRCDSSSFSSVSMDTISALTELEDLEKVYQQLCAEEVRTELCNVGLWFSHHPRKLQRSLKTVQTDVQVYKCDYTIKGQTPRTGWGKTTIVDNSKYADNTLTLHSVLFN